MSNKILIIDDTLVIRNFLVEVLVDEGYDVDVAENGAIGHNMVSENEYSVIFCDVHMPVMNGLQAVKKIKQLKPDIPIVMIDSYPSKLAKDATDAGAIKCLAKPFSLDELRDTLNQIFKNREVSS